MDRELKQNYPGIYTGNLNVALKMLRKSDYWLYYPAAIMIRAKRRS